MPSLLFLLGDAKRLGEEYVNKEIVEIVLEHHELN